MNETHKCATLGGVDTRPDTATRPQSADDAGELLELLHTAHRCFRYDATGSAERERATPGQLRLLRVIARAGHPVRATDVAAALGVTPRSVTTKVDQAEADGHVRRVADPGDRRARLLELTESGRQVLDEMWARRLASAQRRIDRLSAAERARLLELLRAVVEDDPPGGPSDP